MAAPGPEAVDLQLDETREQAALDELRAYFTSLKHHDPESWARSSMSLSNSEERFRYVRSVAPASLFQESSKCLISGMSVGSEMLVARRLGFGEVHATEVEPFFLDFCSRRFQGLPGFFPSLYDGERLAYSDDSFDLILSGHIIEHTAHPRRYLDEHIRVLRPGGYLFLEFPTRYHHTELHTGLRSLEWLPGPLRNVGLIGWRSIANAETKRRLDAILGTHLKQVSFWSIRRWLFLSRHRVQIVDVRRFIPGVLRCLLLKTRPARS
jgi:SAM-dependent methyltransferase